jgi:Transposase IS116/IS110/IS902 family
LNPKVRQPGNCAPVHGRISKAGRTHVRGVLVEAAWSASRAPGPLRAFYQRIRARRGFPTAVVALARKMTTLAWHLVTKDCDYAFARPGLLAHKRRKLELAAGAPPLRGSYGTVMCSCDRLASLGRFSLGLLPQSLIRGLPVEAAVRPVVVVEVLPLFEAGVEDVHVVDDDALEQPVELLRVDAMTALYLAVEPRSTGSDVDVPDALVQHVPMKPSAELGAIVSLDLLDGERQLRQHVVEELDRGFLVERRVDLHDP